ncbi:hypothetical protein MSAN_01939500 [Mycena sanguinolenta]|uniref:Uncharacterized protein n=1 Tax=Mycena sanguinolenta TaxID=230812 RepID=A0A8H7CNS7_9AGAR|nr:hypothetical protein MSAN_01939500 [Mycena sanguinolenta]
MSNCDQDLVGFRFLAFPQSYKRPHSNWTTLYDTPILTRIFLLMDPENTPVPADLGSDAGPSGSQTHLCSRCMREVESAVHVHRKPFEITVRVILMSVACLLCILIFALVVGHLAVGEKPNAITVFLTIWTDVTLAIVCILLYMGHRHPEHKLGRTVTQIRVLCALGVSWIFLLLAMMGLQFTRDAICHGYWNDAGCRGLFIAAHVFSWLLMFTLFAAAYATYRKAVTIHGATMVPLPETVMVPAWRLSGVAETEGSIKI